MCTMMCIKIALTLGVHHPRGMVMDLVKFIVFLDQAIKKWVAIDMTQRITHRASRCKFGRMEVHTVGHEVRSGMSVPKPSKKSQRQLGNMKNTTFVLHDSGSPFVDIALNPLRSVGSRSKEQALPQLHNIICSHQ